MTHNDHAARKVDGIQQHPPAGLELALAVVDGDELVALHGTVAALEAGHKAARRKVEADGQDGKEAKGADLRADTREGNVLAVLELADGVGVSHLRARDDDCADELQQHRKDVEADKDRRQPARRYPQQALGTRLGRHDVEDDAAKGNIDNTGHEDGGQDDETELHNVDVAAGDIVRGADASTIAYGFHCFGYKTMLEGLGSK